MKYAYSLNEEDYFGPFDTYEEARAEGAASVEEGQKSFWIAEVIDTASRLREGAEFIADWVMDIIEAGMCEFIPAEDEMLDATREELETMGNAIIDAVLANCKVVRFGVDNAVEVYVTGEGDDDD